MTAPARRTLSECPVEKIREIQEQHPEICVNIQKRNLKGQMANLPQRFCAITDLIDGTLENELREEAGGGDYRIDPRDRETRQINVVDAYVLTIAGPAKAAGTNTDGVARPAVRPFIAPPTYREQAAADARAQQQHDPNTIWSAPPDAIAMQVAEDYRNKTIALERKLDETVSRLTRANEDLRKQLDAKAREAERIANESKLDLIRQEMRALVDKPAAKPTLDGPALVGLATAFGTIVTTMFTSSAERQRLEVERQAQAAERQRAAEQAQMQLILGLFKKDDKGNNSAVDILKVLAPLLTPLLPKLFEGRDPTKAAELLSTMAENQMSMLSMVATSMQSMMGEPENPIIQMLRETLGGVLTAASKATEIAQSQNPANRNVPGVPADRPMAAQATPAAREPVTEVVQQAPANAKPATVTNGAPNGRPMTALQIATHLMQHPDWPENMKHPEWKTILVAMHGTSPAESVGVEVAHTLETMHDKGILREDLALVFTNNTDQPPSEFLRPVFDMFPIAEMDPERYAGILRGIDGEISEVVPAEDEGEATAGVDA